MQWILVFILPASMFAVLGLVFPGPGETRSSRLRTAMHDRIVRAWRRLVPRHEPPPDPFKILHLQTRLGVLADQVRLLECDDTVYAKAQRLTATRAAYDDLLAEACRLAGVEVDPLAERGDDERMREELELTARGWSW